MKLIYATDIHGDFEKVMSLLYGTIADVYIIAGDLIDIPFYNMGSSIRYHELQSYFHGLRREMRAEDMLIEDFVDELLESPDVSDEIREIGMRYRQYTIRARRVTQQKYKVLKNIIYTKQKSQVLCLPGNYDMDLKFTALHDNDLHLRWYQTDGLKIGGYGGAAVWTAGIPERYIVRYKAGMEADVTQNEMYRFFRAVKPDIIVAHQPAYGIHDTASYGGPVGSPSLRTYCDDNRVLLCLTGHAHDAWGVQHVADTFYLNPSNLGEVTTVTGEVSEGGFFYQIEIENRNIEKIIFRKISNGNIFDVADYYVKNGSLVEDIIDRERYGSLKKGQNYDESTIKYSQIPEIELFNDIKKFYRAFQTSETEDRIDILEEVVQLFKDKVKGNIAMDVMGSVNMGISQKSSDIDFVIYLRCGENCINDFGKCKRSEQAVDMIREILGTKYDFDILDCINLDQVEKSIRERNYECEVTQRFVSYRSMCRSINYRFIAPVEDLLNKDILFRKELEGSVQSYLKIFTTTSMHMISFKKYESRLNAVGVRLPESIRRKIRQYLKEENSGGSE
jgi:Icc-related predicted phosphoesterase